MQPPADFRNRARAVRLESKSFLRAVRAERLARSREPMAGSDAAMNESGFERNIDSGIRQLEVDLPQGTVDIQPLTVSTNATRVSRLAQAAAPGRVEQNSTADALQGVLEELVGAPAEITAIDTSLKVEESSVSPEEIVPLKIGEIEAYPETDVPVPPSDLSSVGEEEVEVMTAPASEALSDPSPIDAMYPTAGPSELGSGPVFHLPLASLDEVNGSDLNGLPGVGPGLIWMFQKIGIHSQKDLACSDAEDICARLGVIGQLLDLRSWIVSARKSVTADD